jgi:hypothetical protein
MNDEKDKIWCSFCKKMFYRKELRHWEFAKMKGRLCKDCIEKNNIGEDELGELLQNTNGGVNRI